jgi:hypothetical protein
VVSSTLPPDSPLRKSERPWGADVVGWVMRRRRPTFVDVNDRGRAGIFQPVQGVAQRYLLCVPLPLPSACEQRTKLLLDPSIPCIVASLNCVDETGNFERMNQGQGPDDDSSGTLMGAVASELALKVLDKLTRERI